MHYNSVAGAGSFESSHPDQFKMNHDKNEKPIFDVYELKIGDLVKVTSLTDDNTLSFWNKNGRGGILTIDSPAILTFLDRKQKFKQSKLDGTLRAYNVFYFLVENTIIPCIRPGEGETMYFEHIKCEQDL